MKGLQYNYNLALPRFKDFTLILLIVNLPLNQNLLLLFVFWYSGVLLICFMWDKVGRVIVSRNFSVKFYHYLIQKDCVTHMHHLAVFMKEGLSVTLNLPLEKLKDYYFFLAFCLFFPFHMTVTVIFSVHSFWCCFI